MDLIRKQSVLYLSLASLAVLSVLLGVAVAKLNAWELAQAQEDAVAADGSFACEPLVFTLSATDEATASGSPIAQASGSASPTATARATSSPESSASASPTSTAAAKGGVSPTPRATATATSTATARPTSTATSTPKGGNLPDAGISTPTIVGIAAGFLLLLAAALLAL